MDKQQNQNSYIGGELVLYVLPDVEITVIEGKIQLADAKQAKAINTILNTHNAQFRLLAGERGKPLSQTIFIVQATDLNALKMALLEHATVFDTGYIKRAAEDPEM